RTDLQQPFTSWLTKASDTGVITDKIFSARHMHVDELRRMNSSIAVVRGSIIVSCPVQLVCGRVIATDLRAGAALVVAGLMANGITEITGLDHIDRGYERMTEKLTNLGAHVWREDMTEEEIAQIHSS